MTLRYSPEDICYVRDTHAGCAVEMIDRDAGLMTTAHVFPDTSTGRDAARMLCYTVRRILATWLEV